MSRRLAKLNWVADVLSPLAVTLMEAFWVYPWLVWIGKWSVLVREGPPLSLVSVILLLGTSFFVTRFFLSRTWSLSWVRLSIVACGLALICVVLRFEYGGGLSLLSGQWFVQMAQTMLGSFSHPDPVVIAMAAGVYLWWRGISRGRSPLYFDDVYRSFLVGLGASVTLIIFWGLSFGAGSLTSLTSTAGVHVAGFFFFGLSALALTNLQAVQREIRDKEGVAPAFGRRWLSIIVGVIGGIILAGASAASIFSAEFVSLLGKFFGLASDLLFKALYYLFLLIGFLVEGLYYVGEFLLNLFRYGQSPQSYKPPDFLTPGTLPEAAARVVSPGAIEAIKWAFFGLVAAGLIFLLTRAVVRFLSPGTRDDVEEIHESLWSWGEFREGLRLLVSAIQRRLRRWRMKLVPVGAVRRSSGDDLGRLSIRAIYQRLLWQASRCNVARRGYETPYEYARRLGQVLPDGSDQVTELTSLYVSVRYGDREADDMKVDHANSLWRFLHGLLGRLEGSGAK